MLWMPRFMVNRVTTFVPGMDDFGPDAAGWVLSIGWLCFVVEFTVAKMDFS